MNLVKVAANRSDVLNVGFGIKGQAFDRQMARTSGALTDGTVYYQGCGFIAGDIVTNVITQIAVVGNTVTLSKVGIYDKTGTRLGLSADQGSNWTSTGVKVIALTSPVTIPSTDMYYLAIVSKASVTVPGVLQGATSATGILGVASNALESASQTGQTDLPSPGTVTAANSLNVWMAWS